MGSLLKTPVVAIVGFLLLLPAVVYGNRFVRVNMFVDKNCTQGPGSPGYLSSHSYLDFNQTSNVTFVANPFNISQTFESAILSTYTGNVRSLAACQAGLLCNATGAIQISFNLSNVGACSTAGPPGTRFDRFLLS